MKGTIYVILLSVALVGTPSTASADPTPAKAKAKTEAAAKPKRTIPPETVGDWRWRDKSRPIKAMAIGGSVTAWPRGPYTAFLHAACPNVEIVNKGKVGVGARQLKERFVKQLVSNRRTNLKKHETWLLFQGGLNSLGTPYRTNRDVRDIFKRAHKHGVKVVALSLMSWGNLRRFRGARGLGAHWRTQLAVDFVLGKLTPQQALDNWARGRTEKWEPGELPNVAINMYESPLRDKDAALLPDTPRLRRQVKTDKWVKSQLRKLAAGDKEAAVEKFVQTAREMPRWFIKKRLRAFDSIHPNMDGHRIMANHVCPKLPAAWGCQCGLIPSMKWDRKARGLQPVAVKAAASAPTAPTK